MRAFAGHHLSACRFSVKFIISFFRIASFRRHISSNRETSFYKVDDLPVGETMALATDYSSWSNEQLVMRVSELEQQLREQNESFKKQQQEQLQITAAASPSVESRGPQYNRQFDPSKYNTRYIALKVAYLGQRYNGFEHHANNTTSLPTIEEELWKALSKTRLIFPESSSYMDWKGCEYSKCGRTDKGVSAFGQVIALQVRSAQPKLHTSSDEAEHIRFDPFSDELPYPKILNRVLPDDIRVLAWCPSPSSDFSARFSCRERRYRYFFTQPAYISMHGNCGLESRRNGAIERDGWLDISAMQKAAQSFVGAHDFRNFCKIDPARQITNYERTIFKSAIEECDSLTSLPKFLQDPSFGPYHKNNITYQSKVYCLTVHGSAFLWHQIRHMVAILFLVGQGLEDPSVVAELLDVQRICCKPHYDMADDAPLVLWDCIFPSESGDQRVDALEWVYPDGRLPSVCTPTEAARTGDGRYGPGGLNETVWTNWRRKKMDELLAGSLLDLVAFQTLGRQIDPLAANGNGPISGPPRSTKVFDGGNNAQLKGKYTPVLKRERMESVDILNARFLERKKVQGTNIGSAC